MVLRWLAGQTKFARKDYLDYVLEKWRSLPDRDPSGTKPRRPHTEYVAVDWRVRAMLKKHRDRTGRGTHSLLSRANDVPQGLTPRVIEGWLAGYCKTARKDHLDYVRKLWRRLPSQ